MRISFSRSFERETRESERRETTGARGKDEREWGRFIVLCELVLDQWGFKAYKSTAVSTGFVLSSILSARRTRRGSYERIPSVPRLNVARRSLPILA